MVKTTRVSVAATLFVVTWALWSACKELQKRLGSQNKKRNNKHHIVIERGALAGKRCIIVGDVHGCLDEFRLLLHKCNFDEQTDQLILVGDLVNKGPNSAEVVQYIRRIKNVLCVKGNHEESLLKALEKPIELRADKYNYAKKLSAEDIAWLISLPYTITIEDFESIVVHAGLLPQASIFDQTTSDMVKMRNVSETSRGLVSHESPSQGVPWASLWTGPYHIYFGHDAVRGLQCYQHATGIDTGCCYGRSLTAIILPSKLIVQVRAIQLHHAPSGEVLG